MGRRHLLLLAVVVAAAIAALFAPRGVSAADVERGRALYELRCGTCHSESVHGRAKRVAADFADVRRWVVRWGASLGLAWSDEEVDDVAVYLNATYYRYPCPPNVCKVVSLARTTVRLRMPWAPWISTPSMSAVAEGPVMKTP